MVTFIMVSVVCTNLTYTLLKILDYYQGQNHLYIFEYHVPLLTNRQNNQ